MGILDKVKFWKKDDFTLDMGPSDLGKPAEQSFDLGGQQFRQSDPLAPRPDQFSQQFSYPQASAQPQPFGQQESFGHEVFQQQYPQQQYPAATPFPGTVHQEQYAEHSPSQINHRDMELILAKLDAIKAELDSLHQRVRKIEQVTDNQQTTQKRYW